VVENNIMLALADHTGMKTLHKSRRKCVLSNWT
jgi:hypothetical protein